MIAQGDHMPVHLGSMPLSVRAAIQSRDIRPGDMVILNDPYAGGTHLPDITLVSGVFQKAKRKLRFYVASRAHHSDVGGMSPGSMPIAEEIYQEGLRIPPVKLVSGGVINSDVWDLILLNVRTPVEREGDLAAMFASNRTGERRLMEVVAKYGWASSEPWCARNPELQRAHDAARDSRDSRRDLRSRRLSRRRRHQRPSDPHCRENPNSRRCARKSISRNPILRSRAASMPSMPSRRRPSSMSSALWSMRRFLPMPAACVRSGSLRRKEPS